MTSNNSSSKNSGRGFAGMSAKDREAAARKGGENSHGGRDGSSNRSGRGSNLTDADRSEGGKNSHDNS